MDAVASPEPERGLADVLGGASGIPADSGRPLRCAGLLFQVPGGRAGRAKNPRPTGRIIKSQ